MVYVGIVQMNLRPHWWGMSEARKKQKNNLTGLYKQKTTTGWPRSESIERSMDKEFAKLKEKKSAPIDT